MVAISDWRLHESIGSVRAVEQAELDRQAAENARQLDALRRAARNATLDLIWDF